MSLSICMVTRDAEQSIGRLLRSVAPLRAEIVVADTGSRDGTVQVARSLGASVRGITWQDDFASAQNLALERATGDWVLWLNPDEEVLPAGLALLPDLLARPDAFAYVVRIQEVMDPKQPDRAPELQRSRLFRRHPAVRFAGRLHPHFATPLETIARQENGHLFTSDLVVRHHAYLSVLTDDKLRWANHLLERELQDRPGQLHYLIEYGRNLLRLDEPRGHAVLAGAADLVLASANAPQAPTSTVASLLEYVLTVSPEQSRCRLTTQQAVLLARQWFFSSPPLLWLLALRAFGAEDYQDAAALLERLVHLGRMKTYDPTAAFDPSILTEPAFMNLGNCYLRLNDPARAETYFTLALSSPAHQAQARHGIARARAAQA